MRSQTTSHQMQYLRSFPRRAHGLSPALRVSLLGPLIELIDPLVQPSRQLGGHVRDRASHLLLDCNRDSLTEIGLQGQRILSSTLAFVRCL